MQAIKPMYHPDALPLYRRNQLLADKAKLVKLRTKKHEEFQNNLGLVCLITFLITLALLGLMFWNIDHHPWSFWGFMGPVIGMFVSGCICSITGQVGDTITTDEVDELDAKIQALDLELAE